MADDDVQLTDLEVIQRYSLAVRGPSASRADIVAALQADLDWLRSGRPAKGSKPAAGAAAKAPAKAAAKAEAPAATRAARSAPAKAPAAKRRG
jgi:hypothetical protein